MASAEILRVDDLHAFYGKSHVLQGVALEIGRGEVVGLLGRNGVGKTTTLKAIMGLIGRRGSIRFEGRDISTLAAHEVPRRGISYVPQGRHVFPEFTVRENLAIALIGDGGRLQERMEAAFTHFPVLRQRLGQLGGTLSGGEQQMLAFARSLMAGPSLILMDEPSEGLSPVIIGIIRDRIKAIHDSGVSILLVEQNVRLALATCQRVYFMEKGQIKHAVETGELRRDESVISRYLGVEV